MVFKDLTEAEKYFKEHKTESEIHSVLYLILKDHKEKSYLGKVITDSYCNGFFGRRYDLEGSKIIEIGHDYMVVKLTEGNKYTCYFEEGGQQKNMYKYIEKWTRDR